MRIRQRPDIQVAALITAFNSGANRAAMHAVRRALVGSAGRARRAPALGSRTTVARS